MKYLVIFVNIGFLILLPFSAYFALYYQVFDHYLGLLVNSLAQQVFWGLITSLPLVILLSNGISWFLYTRQRYSAALAVGLLPLIPILIFLVIVSNPPK